MIRIKLVQLRGIKPTGKGGNCLFLSFAKNFKQKLSETQGIRFTG
jgi:hypothetical protein